MATVVTRTLLSMKLYVHCLFSVSGILELKVNLCSKTSNIWGHVVQDHAYLQCRVSLTAASIRLKNLKFVLPCLLQSSGTNWKNWRKICLWQWWNWAGSPSRNGLNVHLGRTWFDTGYSEGYVVFSLSLQENDMMVPRLVSGNCARGSRSANILHCILSLWNSKILEGVFLCVWKSCLWTQPRR